MNDRHQIQLHETSSDNPPELLDKMRDSINELFDCSVSAAGSFVKGKSEQELAKAVEIKTKAFSHLANLDLERQRLLVEQNQLIREDKQKMYELKTQRLEAVINSLEKLQKMGAKVKMETFEDILVKAMQE
jgi:hypothetical protein